MSAQDILPIAWRHPGGLARRLTPRFRGKTTRKTSKSHADSGPKTLFAGSPDTKAEHVQGSWAARTPRGRECVISHFGQQIHRHIEIGVPRDNFACAPIGVGPYTRSPRDGRSRRASLDAWASRGFLVDPSGVFNCLVFGAQFAVCELKG
jgi:hypothetical protein